LGQLPAKPRQTKDGSYLCGCLVSGIMPGRPRLPLGPIQELLDFSQYSGVLSRFAGTSSVRWLRRIRYDLARFDHGRSGKCLCQSEQLTVQFLGPVGQLLCPLHQFSGGFLEFFCCALKFVRVAPPDGQNCTKCPLWPRILLQGGTHVKPFWRSCLRALNFRGLDVTIIRQL
jgi:hypothetical protein